MAFEETYAGTTEETTTPELIIHCGNNTKKCGVSRRHIVAAATSPRRLTTGSPRARRSGRPKCGGKAASGKGCGVSKYATGPAYSYQALHLAQESGLVRLGRARPGLGRWKIGRTCLLAVAHTDVLRGFGSYPPHLNPLAHRFPVHRCPRWGCRSCSLGCPASTPRL